MILRSITFLIFTLVFVYFSFGRQPGYLGIKDTLLLSEVDNVKPKNDSTALSTKNTSNKNTGGESTNNIESSKIMKVLRFSDFYDSVVTDIPDSAIFPEWDYKEIHERKFDFYNAKDTQLVILADSFGCNYYHPVDNRVTSDFGVRKWRFHYGIDVKLNTGDPVHASWDGVVRISRYSRSYGNVVVIRHDNGLETLYAHLSKRLVKTDSLVHAGEVIGLGGNTGRSYGSHLHFEVRYFDEAINPRDIIDFDNYCLVKDTLYLSSYNYRYREQVAELEKIVFHTIRSGDTLSHLARRYGTSVYTICRLNGISRNKILRIGRRLRVR